MIFLKIFLTIICAALILYFSGYGIIVIKNIWTKELDITKTLPNPFNFIHFRQVSEKERPYLIPKLVQNSPAFTIDGQSRMIFTLMNGKFLYMRFQLNNSERVPAINLRGKYDSPTQKNVYFDMGENVILPLSSSQRLWTPHINIQSIVNEQSDAPFDVTLTIEYDDKNNTNNLKYLSFLKLKIKKESNDKYRIIEEKVTFGNQKIEE